MNITSIIYFLLVFPLLGYSIYKIFKLDLPEDVYEKATLFFGFGLAIFPILSIVLNTLKIPLYFLTYLAVALLWPAGMLVKRIAVFFTASPSGPDKQAGINVVRPPAGIQHNFRSLFLNKKTASFLLVLLFSAVILGVYLHGSNIYGYLEDDDPYYHAEGAKYVSLFKTYTSPFIFTTYLEPYPPAYDVFMGVMHQMNDDLQGTLKFFNSLLLALSLLFYYYFFKKLTKSNPIALLATFFLTVLPCFFSHFIQAQALSLVLYPIALYVLIDLGDSEGQVNRGSLIKNSYGKIILFGLFSASIYVTQPSAAVIFLVFAGIYFLSVSISARKIQKIILLAIMSGLLLAQIYYVPTILRNKNLDAVQQTEKSVREGTAILDKFWGILKGTEPLELKAGEQTRTFYFNDFQTAPKKSRIDQPTGIGISLFYLFLASLGWLIVRLFKHKFKNAAYLTAFFWLAFAFLGLEGNEFPINMIPHRFWAFFAIPVALISAIGADYFLKSQLKAAIKIIIAVIFTAGILITSAYPKYIVETDMWASGTNKWSSQEQLQGYIYLKNNFRNLKVFPLCELDNVAIAFNQLSYSWDREVRNFRDELKNKSLEDLVVFLRRKGYGYYTLTSNCVPPEPFSNLGKKTEEFFLPEEYLIYNNAGFFLFKVPER